MIFIGYKTSITGQEGTGTIGKSYRNQDRAHSGKSTRDRDRDQKDEVLHMSIGDTQPTQPSLSEENWRFCFTRPLLSVSTRLTAHIRTFWSCRSHLCRTVSRPRTESSLCPLFENVFVSS